MIPNIKRILAILIAIPFVVTLTVTAVSAADDYDNNPNDPWDNLAE